MDTKRCEGRVWQSYGFSYSPCSRNGKFERDGKWYCKQHDPVSIKERRKARDAKWEAERKVRHAAWDWEAAAKLVCSGMTTAELEALGPRWLLNHFHPDLHQTTDTGYDPTMIQN